MVMDVGGKDFKIGTILYLKGHDKVQIADIVEF